VGASTFDLGQDFSTLEVDCDLTLTFMKKVNEPNGSNGPLEHESKKKFSNLSKFGNSCFLTQILTLTHDDVMSPWYAPSPGAPKSIPQLFRYLA